LPPATDATAFGVETIDLDLPALCGALSQRLHAAGLPVNAARSSSFARALTLVRPLARRRLYWTARAVFVSDQSQLKAFDAVFWSIFGDPARPQGEPNAAEAHVESAPPDGSEPPALADPHSPPESPGPPSVSGDGSHDRADTHELPVPLAPSEEEVLREKRFDKLEPAELARLYRLMSEMALATPLRRTRRAERHRHGKRIDLRRSVRESMRTGGDPFRLRRRRRRITRRRMVLLCDISGSMEPYARAYIQFLTCAAGSGRRVETFVFATRLTRLTRVLGYRDPQRAFRAAAAAAPDWSSGTRIGEALKTFNDRHGRRGMARGAVIVILSDGWERGDPALVAREMERLARLAHRVVWVNPRAAAAGFVPRAGGMAAALPHCDALLSGHNLNALDEVLDAIHGGEHPVPTAGDDDDDSWASATPMPGSSVAMPSGYAPRRGHTTPGWR
jgi:uncharacterized protein with von Willebrand factor type A (vWA) domain